RRRRVRRRISCGNCGAAAAGRGRTLSRTRMSSLITESASAPPFDPVYFETIFVVPSPPRAWPSRFAIVTAHNPDGRIAPESANNESERALVEHLRRERIDSFAVVG